MVHGAPIATAWSQHGGPAEDPGALERLVRNAVVVGYERTLDQDAAYGFRQLEDIAVKALCATTAYWGTPETDRWWFSDISRFAVRPSVSGLTALINLVQLPTTALLYATGIAAVARGRADLVARLFTQPTTTNNYGNDVPVSTQLAPGNVLMVPRPHRSLHEYLRPLLQSHLTLGEAAYTDASEQFEYLRLAFETDMRLTEDSVA